MANLVLDVTVKGADKSEKEVKALGVVGEKIQKTFAKIGKSDNFTKLNKHIKLTRKAFKDTREAADSLAKNLKDVSGNGFRQAAINAQKLLDIEEEINIEIKKQAKLQRKLNDFGGNNQTRALEKQLKTTKKQTAELRKQTGVIKKNSAATKKMGSSLGSVGKIIGGGLGLLGFVSIITSIQSAVSSLTRAWVRMGKAVANSFFDINSEMEQMKILLSTAAGSEEGGAALFKNILNFAQKAPFSISSLTDSFVKLKTAGINPLADGTLQTLVDSVAAFGGSSEQLRLVTIAIQQMVGKGVVSMEELRRQFGEQVPTAMRAMAEGLGMSILDMFDLISKGGLEASRGIEAMLGVLEKWHGGAAEKRMNSMKGAIVRLKNAWLTLMDDLGNSQGAFKAMQDVVRNVATAIDKFRASSAGRNIMSDISDAITETADLIKKNPTLISDYFQVAANSMKLAAQWGKKLFDIFVSISNFAFESTGIEKIKTLASIPFKITILAIPATLVKSVTELVTGKTPSENLEEIKKLWASFFGEAYTTNAELAELDWNLGIDSEAINLEDYKTAAEKVAEANKKMFEGMPGLIEGMNAEIDELTANLSAMKTELKETVSGLRDEEFNLELKLFSDSKQQEIIKQKIVEMGELASEAARKGAAGHKDALMYLEKQRDLIKQLGEDAKKVTKVQVEGARKAYEHYYRISRGGKVAGSSDDLKKLRDEYERLARLQKEGKTDTQADNALIKEKLGLLRENTTEVERVKNAGLYEVEAKIKSLEDEVDLYKTALANQELSTDEIGNAIKRTDELVAVTEKLNQQWINIAKNQATYSSGSSASGTYYDFTNRYAGGPVSASQPYIVGEKGPELFVPKNNGNIVPNNELQGGSSTEITLNFNGNKVGPMFSTKQIAKDVLREFETMQGALS